jgi:assimilatory nitrate reductase catalytic subunit
MLDRPTMKRSPGSLREREHQVRTVCQECGVACGLVAGVAGGRVVDVQGDEDHPVSRGTLCARGTAFVQGLTAPERLAAPAIRRTAGGAFQPLDDWKSGLDLLAERLRQLRERRGPDSLLIACDREGGLDFYLGALRFAGLWGTSQVFHSGGRSMDPWPDGLEGPTAPCSDWIHAGCLLLVEADLAATHPVAFARVQEARRRGAKVVATDARFTGTLAKCDRALRTRPGQGNLLGLALAKLLLSEGGAAADAALADAAGWRGSLAQMSLDGIESALGITAGELENLARLLASSGPVTLITGRALAGLPHHRVWLALAAAMGWAGRPGGGWYPLDSGAPPLEAHLGAGAPGEAGPPAAPGLREVEEQGRVAAILCSGDALSEYVSPFGPPPRQVELVAHFGAFPNGTWERASMTFPATLWPEREGLVFGDDRSVDWGARLVPPPPGCRSGLDFWMELARRFGWEAQFPWAAEDGQADHAAFYAWVLAQHPSTAGVQLERVQHLAPGARIRWAGGEGSPALRGLAPPPAPPHLAPAAAEASAEYPLTLLQTQSSLSSGDASRFWPWTRGLLREDAVQIDPETARLLGIESGDEVRVDTPRGACEGRAQVSRTVARGLVASLRAGGAPLPALVHRKDQLPDEARALLKNANP